MSWLRGWRWKKRARRKVDWLVQVVEYGGMEERESESGNGRDEEGREHGRARQSEREGGRDVGGEERWYGNGGEEEAG